MRVFVLFLGLAGCTYRVYSPPARSLPLITPRPPAQGQTSLSGEVAVHSLLFGPTVAGGDLRFTHGVAQGALEVEGTVFSVSGDPAAGTSPIIAAGRVGYRQGGRRFGWGVGLGGGGSAAGAFFSPDFTLTVGYENCYLVPFASLRSAVSVPIAARAVDVSKGEDGPGAHVLAPRVTGILTPTLGLSIPLVRQCAYWPATRIALLVGIAWTVLGDGHQTDGYFGAGTGVTLNF